MATESGPFEDVSPIENWCFPASHVTSSSLVFDRCSTWWFQPIWNHDYLTIGVILQKLEDFHRNAWNRVSSYSVTVGKTRIKLVTSYRENQKWLERTKRHKHLLTLNCCVTSHMHLKSRLYNLPGWRRSPWLPHRTQRYSHTRRMDGF